MATEIQQFEKLLTKNNHYITKARLRLFIILQKHPALSVKELISLLPKHDQATVYRNIKTFEKLGVIARLQLGWHSKLELSDMFRHHHHHLTCIKCGRIIGLPENSELEQQIANLTKELNFKQADHQLEIRGLCKECALPSD
jgi:Fur family ferric uptake transcriptional regulator